MEELQIISGDQMLKMSMPDPGVKVDKNYISLVIDKRKVTYDIPLTQCKSSEDILEWSLHLLEKVWVTREQLSEFILQACIINKIDIGTWSRIK